MAETHNSLYLKIPKSVDLESVRALFNSQREEEFLETSRLLNPEQGPNLIRQLLGDVGIENLLTGGAERKGALVIVHFTFGYDGQQVLEKVIFFVKQILPSIKIWAYFIGDDDPWEIFFKEENNVVINEEVYPDEDDAENVIKTIYAWWHKGLPKSICRGYLVDSREEVPAPLKARKIITKTKVTVPDGYYWEMIFFKMLPNHNENPEHDKVEDFWMYEWERSDEEYHRTMLLFKLLRANFQKHNIVFEKHEGQGCNINYNFSSISNENIYQLSYAALCSYIGANVKQFATVYKDREEHYICSNSSVAVQSKKNGTIVDTKEYNIDQLLQLIG